MERSLSSSWSFQHSCLSGNHALLHKPNANACKNMTQIFWNSCNLKGRETFLKILVFEAKTSFFFRQSKKPATPGFDYSDHFSPSLSLKWHNSFHSAGSFFRGRTINDWTQNHQKHDRKWQIYSVIQSNSCNIVLRIRKTNDLYMLYIT